MSKKPQRNKSLGQVVYEATYQGAEYLRWQHLDGTRRAMFERGARDAIAEWAARLRDSEDSDGQKNIQPCPQREAGAILEAPEDGRPHPPVAPSA